MRLPPLGFGLALVALSPSAHAAPAPRTLAVMGQDAKGSADTALVGRYEGSFILGETKKAFDEIALASGPAQGSPYADHKYGATVTAHGQVTRQLYLAPAGRSTLELASNYFDALKAKGLQQIFSCARDACGEAFSVLQHTHIGDLLAPNMDQTRDFLINASLEYVVDIRYGLFKSHAQDGDTYVAVYVGQNRGGSMGDFSAALDGRVLTRVDVVAPRTMEHKIVTVSAAEIADKITTEGRVAFYGIFFDFDKAELKPESDPQLAQMAAFIKAHAATPMFITGHTDNQGGLAYNLSLSQRRAAAVAKALTARYGVGAARLAAHGLANLAPLASNATEAGRAKNRRVELVTG